MNQKSISILDALHSVDCGQDVYQALTQVPRQNLMDMHDMIAHILYNQEQTHGYPYTDSNGIQHGIFLTQDAYISDCGKYYEAHGESILNGFTYSFILTWAVTNPECIDEIEDQADACNWDDYTVLELGNDFN